MLFLCVDAYIVISNQKLRTKKKHKQGTGLHFISNDSHHVNQAKEEKKSFKETENCTWLSAIKGMIINRHLWCARA